VCIQSIPNIKVLGDFSGNVGRVDVFKPIVRNESSHEICDDNGVRVVKFATSKNLIIKSTMFPHHSIHNMLGLLFMGLSCTDK